MKRLSLKHMKPRQGFTLVEVMVVLIIFAVGALGTAAMTMQSIRSNAINKLRTKSTSVIQAKIEDLRLQVAAGTSPTNGNDELEGLARTWTVYDDQPSVGLITVVVEVRWAHAPYNDARFLRYASIFEKP